MLNEEPNTAKLEAQLAQAQARLRSAVEALASRHIGGEMEEWVAAEEECLAAERALALARGEETALHCPWEVKWDAGAPLPHIIASGRKAYLLYLISKPDPNWDGSYVTMVDPGSRV